MNNLIIQIEYASKEFHVTKCPNLPCGMINCNLGHNIKIFTRE